MLTNVKTQRYSRVKTSQVVSTQMEATLVAVRKVTLKTRLVCVKVRSIFYIFIPKHTVLKGT